MNIESSREIARLKEKLGIPASEPDSQRLSWLRTTYVFEMSDVSNIVREYLESH